MDFKLSKEQRFLQKTVKEFVTKEIEPVSAQTDRSGHLSDTLINKMVAIQLPGMMVPEKYNGNGSTLLDCALTIEQLSYSGCGAWWYVAFTNSIPDCIATFGTRDQKEKYLAPVVHGEMIHSIQFTEEDTGSDPGMLQTRAVPDGNGYNVNGMKRFSTFGARPGYAVLYTLDENERCTAFLMEKLGPGYSTSLRYPLMGSGGMEAVDVYLENIKLTENDILGRKSDGFGILLFWVAIEKILQCAACVGIAKAAVDEAVRYAQNRMVRGKPQHRLQGIQFMIAEMHAKLQACRWITYRDAFLKDRKDATWISEAAAAKLFVVPATMEIVDKARRIHGASGYTKESKIERLYRAIAGASAIAGSLEVNRSIVANALIKSDGR